MKTNCKNKQENIIPQTKDKPETAVTLLNLVKKTLDDDKAEDVVVINLANKTDIADYMVIASGTSNRQVAAMAEHLREEIKASATKVISCEGMPRCDWVLVDAGYIIIHLFRPEIRKLYNLEKLWGELRPETAA